MGSLVDPKTQARRKGLVAAGLTGGTTLLLITGAAWPFVVGGVAAAGYFTLEWLRFRGRWGLKF